MGLAGGKPGAVNEAVLVRNDGTEELRKATGVVLEAGDRLTFGTAGGGGWGDPLERDRKAVERDIVAGYVSPEAARRDYGYEAPTGAHLTGEVMLAQERRRRLLAAMAEAGIAELVLYGNAWQGDYLRYAVDFGILEGHGIAVVAADGTIELFLDSATDVERAERKRPA